MKLLLNSIEITILEYKIEFQNILNLLQAPQKGHQFGLENQIPLMLLTIYILIEKIKT